MDDFDYGNARLRVMKSRLLSRQRLEELADSGTLKGLITALTQTPYRKSVETALASTVGLNSIVMALKADLITNFTKVRSFYTDGARELVVIALRSYDIYNIKTILRGLSRNINSGEIIESLLPIGDLDIHVLGELARAADPREAIDILVSMNSPYAHPLLLLRSDHPGADTARMELALEKWNISAGKKQLEEEYPDQVILLKSLDLDADITNLLTILRFANMPEERKLAYEWLGVENLQHLFIGPGSLSFALLMHAAVLDTLDAAVNIFETTPYGPSLLNGLDAYHRSDRVSDLERQLQRFRMEWMANKILTDPLGIGMVLGYCSLKVNEINNVRWIAGGINQTLSAEEIREKLEYVT